MQVTIAQVTAQPLAAVRARLASPKVGPVCGAYLDRVYAAARTHGVPLDGQSVFVYWPQADGAWLVDFGVGIREPFDAVGDVSPRATPAGTAATATHVGPYTTLGDTYGAIHAWCREQGHALAGPSWEVYGHWTDDESRLRTDVFYLLEPVR